MLAPSGYFEICEMGSEHLTRCVPGRNGRFQGKSVDVMPALGLLFVSTSNELKTHKEI